MNIVSKKLHELEKNVLPELPEKGTTKITWENGDAETDRAELELHRRAREILDRHKQILEELEYNLKHGIESDPFLSPMLSPQDEAIVNAANKRLMARMFEIIELFGDVFVCHGDNMAKYVFFSRFYWIIEELQKWKEQNDAQDAVCESEGFFELCEGDQERLLAPVYAKWNRDLFTRKSFEQYIDKHRPIRTYEQIIEAQLAAGKTMEQIKQEEKAEAELEVKEIAEDEARNAKYLKEKCPGCTEKCKWYYEQTGEKKE
jgi:hypothetical protein